MKKKSPKKLNSVFLILFIFFFSQFSIGQLANFTLNLNKTNETCTGNGSLSFNVNGATTGSSISYSIYLLPNTTTPISATTSNSLSNLLSGNYRVIALQTFGALTNSQQQDITIVNQTVALTYQLVGQNTLCGSDGKITVNVTTGIAVSYETISGPTIKPLQSSNILTGLAAGNYIVRVFNNCGEAIVQSFTLGASSSGIATGVVATQVSTCTSSIVTLTINAPPQSVLSYPLIIICTINPPTGAPIVYNQTITSAGSGTTAAIFNQTIPLYAGQIITYNIKVTDNCGNISNTNGNISNQTTAPSYQINNSGCTANGFTISKILTATLTSAPAAFVVTLPRNYTPEINVATNTLQFTNMPLGTYVFSVTDLCGIASIMTITLQASPPSPPSAYAYTGCAIGIGTVIVFGQFQEISLTAAPSSYPIALPQNLISLNLNGIVTLENLQVGIYTFHTKDLCNNEFDVTVLVTGYQVVQATSVINIIEKCGSFDIDLTYNSNGIGATYWLQKLDPITNTWGSPSTGVAYIAGTYPTSLNSIALANNTLNLNFGFTGDFRILTYYIGGTVNCGLSIKTFTFTGLPKIVNVFSFICTNNKYDVFVEATGIGALKYRITTKNGNPFVIQNLNSSLFLALNPAIYNFQVEDSCGNIVNSLFEIPRPFAFGLTATTLCSGQNASLSVPNFAFLQYEWWKDNNTSTILSTTNTLQFANFNPITNSGVYHVRIKYPSNPSSCLNFVIDYSINQNINVANAGQDNTVNYCENQGIINLSSLITGNYDLGGTWIETSNSGISLNNNLWNSTTLLGTYTFKYTVNSGCGTSDEAVITIVLKQKPNVSTIIVNPNFCVGDTIQLTVNQTIGATYLWSGPNGFSSNLQNPTIINSNVANSGTYSVTINLNGCSLTTTNSLIVNSTIAPNAGQDNTVTYCENQGIINLSSLITGNYDLGGTWLETSNSGIALNNNLWNSTTASPGSYSFKYKILSGCGTSDESILTIILKPLIIIPQINILPEFCSGENIQFDINQTLSSTYSWTGPNGFTSSIRNPQIINSNTNNSGTYNLVVTTSDCSISRTINVMVKPSLDFEINSACNNGKFEVLVNPIQNSFDLNTAIYDWTGPNNFISTEKSITILNSNIGNYNVTVTNTDGCKKIKSITINSTLCTIPLGISPNNDDKNESFDLTGLGKIEFLKIYNRYGVLVFEQNSYTNQWIGQDYNGNLLPDATYYYLINLPVGESKVGWVYLAKEVN